MDNIMSVVLAPKFLISVLAIIVTLGVYIAVKVIFDKRVKEKRKKGENKTVMHIVLNVVEVAILFIGILTVLQINGINITGLVAGLGIVSAVVGLALQDYLKDIIMGIHILSDHFFSVGECVEYNGREGVIVSLSLKTTKIGDLDDHSVFTVCNRNISEIRRLAERLDIDIPLSYKENVNTVNDTLISACGEIEKIDGVTECRYKGTQSFESSAILYRLRVSCNPEDRADVRRAALSTVQTVLHEAGIQIPYNQLDVHCDVTEKKQNPNFVEK